ncbi:uncharacterized protein LOC134561801 isoform X2 [Prinia subflava]|uniref:uncharacterized protein LOC134561801 isoform X2 n=1 Tax=Prinia subflava TaxID=208062 RepID=UPI002FE1BF5D
MSPFAPWQLQPQGRTRRVRTGSALGELWAGGQGRTGMCLGRAPGPCHEQEALPAPLLFDSAAPSLSPTPASAQSSQHQRGWNPPSSHSPRGWLLLPPFLPRPNQPLCWPPSKKRGCAGVSRATVMSQCQHRTCGQPWCGAGSSPAVPLHTSAVPRPSEPQPSASADMEGGRASDPDANGFDTVAVTTARLSHPTATRPRVPGQRPPSIALGSTGGPRGGEQPQGLPRAALCAPVPSTRQVPVLPWSTEGLEVLEGRSLALEDLKAEVRTLHILVDLMRVQHLRDLQDLRQELCQERVQRQALQVEIERVRKGLPC